MPRFLRPLHQSPGFTFVAVITLALGLGVNAAAFAFVRDMLLTPRARHARQNLVSLYTARTGPSQEYRRFTYDEFNALRESRDVFAEVSAFTFDMAAVGQDEALKRSMISFVPENHFDAFGVRPLAGRFFTAEEASPGADLPVVVVNHTYWQQLGGRADLVGRTLRINQRTFTVIGIAPQGFGSLHASFGPNVWLPLGAMHSLYGTDLRSPRTTELYLFANLAPGVSLEAARERAPALAARLAALQPGADPRTLLIDTPPLFSLGNTGPVEERDLGLFATLTLGLSVSVLFVACLNLGNLLLARGAARRKEIAIRLSLGATRGRVVRQLLAEGLVLALAGGTVGLVIAVWTGEVLLDWANAAFAAGPFAMTIQPAIDWSLLVASLALCLFATVGFSLVPALRATRIDLVEDLKQQPGTVASAGRWNRFFSLRHTLLMGQIALSLMLVFCAGLFVRSARVATNSDPGFAIAHRFVANFDYSYAGLAPDEIARRQQALLDRAASIPGVSSAALATVVPFNFELNRVRVFAANRSALIDGDPAPAQRAGFTAVTHGYFGQLGISLLRGRDFSAAESSDPSGRPVAIIDESLARALFPDEDALGRHLALDPAAVGNPDRAIEIVGIVRSHRNDVYESAPPQRLYRPLAQVREANIYLHLQTTPEAGTALPDRIGRELRAADRDAPLLSFRPLADYPHKNINLLLIDLSAGAFSGFAFVAVVLAVVGIYGLRAYAVAQRTREIGIRMALGAQVADVVRLFLRQSAAHIAIGVGAGIVLAILAGQALSKMLYRVDGFDPVLLAAVATLLAAVVLLASWLPSRRAAKVDPLVALRSE